MGVTRDFLGADGRVSFGDVGLGRLDDAPGVEWEFLAEDRRELDAELVRDYDALLVLTPRVTAATLAGTDRLVIIARFGVGYDSVDVEACTRSGVLLTITPDGVRRPVATSLITLVLALAQKLLVKDRLTRDGRWAERGAHMGLGLTGRVLGLIGLGSIGRDAARLAQAFDLQVLAHDPYVTPAEATAVGVKLVDLATLLRTADFVGITCVLTPETRHLIDGERLLVELEAAVALEHRARPTTDARRRPSRRRCGPGGSRALRSTSSSRSRWIPTIPSCASTTSSSRPTRSAGRMNASSATAAGRSEASWTSRPA